MTRQVDYTLNCKEAPTGRICNLPVVCGQFAVHVTEMTE